MLADFFKDKLFLYNYKKGVEDKSYLKGLYNLMIYVAFDILRLIKVS